MYYHPLRSGVWPVMLTPFADDRSIDYEGLDRLVDWYIDSGVAGLFAVCQSSEMFDLDDEERLQVAERVLKRADNRVPVVATGAYGGPVEAQAKFVMRMMRTGVAAIVVLVNGCAAKEEGDDVWRERASRLLDLTDSIPLGLYECPSPYHRTLTAELVEWATSTGRFLFHKDTSCEIGAIRAKLAVASDDPFRFYNAHTPTLIESLKAGGAGYSGIGANFFPAQYVRLCRRWESDPQGAERIQAAMVELDRSLFKYPVCAKAYVGRIAGVGITEVCRGHAHVLSEVERRTIESWRDRFGDL